MKGDGDGELVKVSTRARYALRMMIDLADNFEPGVPVVLRDIADRQQISKRYLEQLAMSLKHAGLVLVSVGRGGGYALPRPAEEIRVGEIVRATIGEVNVVGCVRHPDSCERAPKCPSRAMWLQLNQVILETFNRVTLADLCEQSLLARAPDLLDQPVPCAKDARLRLVH